MIKLRDLLTEAKNDQIASRVWDYIITNEIYVTKNSLKEVSDQVAYITKKNKQDIFDSVLRIGEQKNWLTTYVMEKVFGKK
tara:strand:- start:1292 stop:1534 length:243 start_codon:yes stop_codon:yes gene_type:complete